MDRQAFVDEVLVRLRARTPTHPQSDWGPALYLELQDECVEVSMDDFPLNLMESERGKDALSRAFADLIRITRPARVAFTSTAWQAVISEEKQKRLAETALAFEKEHGRRPSTYDEIGMKPPSEDPDNRIEILMLACIEAEAVRAFSAEIKRHDNERPRLCEFEDVFAKYEAEGRDMSDASMTGRFAEPLQAAMREVAGA
jgi:hypothetical protein